MEDGVISTLDEDALLVTGTGTVGGLDAGGSSFAGEECDEFVADTVVPATSSAKSYTC